MKWFCKHYWTKWTEDFLEIRQPKGVRNIDFRICYKCGKVDWKGEFDNE